MELGDFPSEMLRSSVLPSREPEVWVQKRVRLPLFTNLSRNP
jgi:hypothetical protein